MPQDSSLSPSLLILVSFVRLQEESAPTKWDGNCSSQSFAELFFFSNYAPTINVGKEAASKDCQQVLWLYGEDQQLTEVGTMNIFVFWRNENNGTCSFFNSNLLINKADPAGKTSDVIRLNNLRN